MKYTEEDFINASKCVSSYLSDNNVVTAMIKAKLDKWVNQINLDIINPDDNLNCAEPWHDYGNYKGVINPKHVCFTYKVNGSYSRGWGGNDWDDMRRGKLVLALIDFNDRVAYRVCREGNEYNHSENNDCPGRDAIAEKIEMPDGANEIIDFYWKEHDYIINDFLTVNEAYQKRRRAEDLEKHNNIITEATEIINGLRKNATRKRAEQEKRIEFAKRQIEYITSGRISYNISYRNK